MKRGGRLTDQEGVFCYLCIYILEVRYCISLNKKEEEEKRKEKVSRDDFWILLICLILISIFNMM